LRVENQLKSNDIVAVVQKHYPSFDKTMLSKCERGDKYGVSIKPNVMDAIIEELVPDSQEAIKRRLRGGHRLTCKVTARLENEDYAVLQQLRERNGYLTMQDLISDLVQTYIEKEHNND